MGQQLKESREQTEVYLIQSGQVEVSTVELDSNTDSPLVCNNVHTLDNIGKKVTVSGFTDALGKFLLVAGRIFLT